MHFSRIIFFLIAAAQLAPAQTTMEFSDENFTAANGFRSWRSNKGGAVKLENGKLIVQNNQAKSMFWTDLPYHFYRDTLSCFEIEFKMTKTNGTFGQGIHWHVGNYDYEYWITTNGYYLVRAFDSNDKIIDLMKDFVQTSDVHQGAGASNTLGVECRRGIITIFLNGKRKDSFCNGEVYEPGTTKEYRKGSAHYRERTSVYRIGLSLPNSSAMTLLRFSSSSKPRVRHIHLIDNPAQGLVKENLGPRINTRCQELNPIVSADDRRILFSVRECDVAGTNPRKDDDLFYSTRDSGGGWQHFKKMPSPFNNENNSGMIGISGDNNTVYYKATYGGSKSDTWFSQRMAEGTWSAPQAITVPRYTEYNQYNGRSISSNRKIMISYFEEANSVGGNDLYVSFSEDGINFSRPKSLGATINSPLSEFGAFLAPDNKTLYFSSYGHGTYGNADVFVSRRLDESWTRWSRPQNLGPEINTSEWDAYFSIIASGKYAYMVSEEGGTGGNSDIVRIPLPVAAKPDPVVLIRGRVLDAKTKKPLHAEVVSTLLKTNTKALVAWSDSAEGRYQIILPAGDLYDFLASKEGYYANSQHIDLGTTTAYTELVKDIYLQPVDSEGTFHLNNIFFVNCSDTLKTESSVELDRLADFMKKNEGYDADIDQFMEKGGECGNEEQLADARALAIKNYLVKKGVAENRLKHKSHVKPLEEKLAEKPENKLLIVPKTNEVHGHVEVRFVKNKAHKIYHVRKQL